MKGIRYLYDYNRFQEMILHTPTTSFRSLVAGKDGRASGKLDGLVRLEVGQEWQCRGILPDHGS